MHGAVRRIALFGFLLAAETATAQEGCTATPQASLPLRTERGQVLVEIAVNDQPVWFAVDTGASSSAMSTKLVARLGLPTASIHLQAPMDIAGNQARKVAYRANVTLADRSTRWRRYQMRYQVADLSVDGLLAADMLGGYDIDLDLAGARMNLFARGACRGTPPGSGPFRVVTAAVMGWTNRIRVPVTLDDREYWAIVDTGAARSYMASSRASADFGIRMDESKARKARGAYGGELLVMPHGFRTLQIGDVTLPNPHLSLAMPDNGFQESPILLGLEHLRALRLFIAYGARRLYISPARQP